MHLMELVDSLLNLFYAGCQSIWNFPELPLSSINISLPKYEAEMQEK